MGGGVITPPYNGWYETYEFKFDDQLIKADNLNWCLKVRIKKTLSLRASALKWRGNPPVEWNHVTITTKNCKGFPLCGAVVDTFLL